jgi:ribosomal protein S18 acetylase RimI-like enzyme
MIRLARRNDEYAIRACVESAYAPYVAAIGSKPAPMVADYAARIDGGKIYVAEDANNRFLGFVVFYPDGRHMLLENVAVLPSARGRGIGKKLITFCEEEARRLGLDAVHLYTNEKMAENLLIYPRLGYAEVARRAQDGFMRVFFAKPLT